MPAASSLQYTKAALDAYHAGKTIRCALLTGSSVAPSARNAFLSALNADLHAAPHQTVTVSTQIAQSANLATTPDRVQNHYTDATFTSVAAGPNIVAVVYYVDTGNATTSPIMHHGTLNPAVTPNGSNIIIRQGSNGVLHAEVPVTP
jgi:hypothetical protein